MEPLMEPSGKVTQESHDRNYDSCCLNQHYDDSPPTGNSALFELAAITLENITYMGAGDIPRLETFLQVHPSYGHIQATTRVFGLPASYNRTNAMVSW